MTVSASFGWGIGHRQIAAADPPGGPRVGRDARPRQAGVIAAEDTRRPAAPAGSGLFGERDRRVQPPVVGRRDGEVGLDDRWEPVGERLPRGPAVGRLEDPAARARPHRVLPRPLPLLPQRGVHDVRIDRVDVDVVPARVLVLVEHLLKGLAAVERSEDAALLVRPVRMAERSDEQAVGVARIDVDARDLLGVVETEPGPRPSRIGGLVDAITRREVGPVQTLAAAHVDDVRIGRRNRDGADGSCGLVIEDRHPRAPGVGRLPDAAIDRRHVEGVWLTPVPGDGHGPACAVRADVAPLHVGEERRTDARRLLGRHGGEHGGDQPGCGKDDAAEVHVGSPGAGTGAV